MLPRQRRRRHLGPLAGSLLLHALGLGLAAAIGITVEERSAGPDTFVLSWARGPGSVAELEPGAGDEPAGSPEPGADGSEEVPLPELVTLAILPEMLRNETAPEQPEAPELVPAAEEAPAETLDQAADLAVAPAAATALVAATSAVGASSQDRQEGAESPDAVRARRTGTSRGFLVVGDVPGSAPLPVGPRPGQARRAGGATPLFASDPRGGDGGGNGGNGGGREATGVATPRPPYPRLSIRAGEEGSVLCRLHVSAAGVVTQVDVVESSGFERLDQAARETLLSWRFEARQRAGASVAATLLHRVTFRLEG